MQRSATLTLLSAALCAVLLAAPAAQAGERLDQIVKTQTLRVGTPGDYRPFSMKEGDGFAGLDIDIVKKMAEVYGWKVEFVHTSWKAMAGDLKANKFDVAVGGITRSPARALIADFLPAYAPFGKVLNFPRGMTLRHTTEKKSSKFPNFLLHLELFCARIESNSYSRHGFQKWTTILRFLSLN